MNKALKTVLKCVTLALFAAVSKASDSPDRDFKLNRWRGYVQDFRSEHNYALSFGGFKSRWSLHPEGWQSGFSARGQGGYLKAQYSYHIPIWREIGYLLGSSIGFQSLEGVDTPHLKTSTSYHLPGILGGFIYNYSPEVRVAFAFDAYVERVEDLYWYDEYTESHLDLNILNIVDSIVWFDVFQKLNWAFRFEYHNRFSKYIQPKGEVSQKVVNLRLSRIDQWIGVGVVYHTL